MEFIQNRHITWAIFIVVFYAVFRLFKSQEGFFKFLAGILLFSVSVSAFQVNNREVNIIWLIALLLAYREDLIKWYWGIIEFIRSVLYSIKSVIIRISSVLYNSYIVVYNGIAFALNKLPIYEKVADTNHNTKSAYSKESTHRTKKRNTNSNYSKRRHKPRRPSKKEEELRQQAEDAVKETIRAKQEAKEATKRARRAEAQARQNNKTQADPPFDTRSAYEILGAQPTATSIEIKRAYKECCQRYHPDKFATRPKHIQDAMEEELKKVQQAYKKIG